MTVYDLELILEQIAPASLKLGNDPIGRCIGSRDLHINKIGVALDATDSVIAACIAQQINVLVTHHPLIYTPLHGLDETSGFPQSARFLPSKRTLLFCQHTQTGTVQMVESMMF